MYVCIYIYTCIYTHTYTHIYLSIYPSIYPSIYMGVPALSRELPSVQDSIIYICIYTYIIYIYTCVHICAYINLNKLGHKDIF